MPTTITDLTARIPLGSLVDFLKTTRDRWDSSLKLAQAGNYKADNAAQDVAAFLAGAFGLWTEFLPAMPRDPLIFRFTVSDAQQARLPNRGFSLDVPGGMDLLVSDPGRIGGSETIAMTLPTADKSGRNFTLQPDAARIGTPKPGLYQGLVYLAAKGNNNTSPVVTLILIVT